MKAEMERDVTALGFEQTIILRPGGVLGYRKDTEGRLYERPLQFILSGLSRMPWISRAFDYFVVRDIEMAKATAILLEKQGKGVKIVSNQVMIELARAYDQEHAHTSL